MSELLYWTYIASLFACTAFAVVYILKNGAKQQQFLIVYLALTLFVDFFLQLKYILGKQEVTNVLWYKIYLIFCVNYFTYFYYSILTKRLKVTLLSVAIIANSYLFYVADFGSNHFNAQQGVTLAIFYIIVSLIWFYYKLQHDLEQRILKDPRFWISSGLLIWGACFIFRTYPSYYFYTNDVSFHKLLKSMMYVINTLLYGVMTIALWLFNTNQNLNNKSS